jgi:hypothetical protein
MLGNDNDVFTSSLLCLLIGKRKPASPFAKCRIYSSLVEMGTTLLRRG